MIQAWLMPNILWLSLLFLLTSAIMGISLLSILGWSFFGFYWFGQSMHYMAIEDYFNVVLVASAAILCFYMAYIIAAKGCPSHACSWASYAAAICGIIYFPFAEIQQLKDWLIGFTTTITADILLVLSVPVIQEEWNMLTLNGRSVEIILACTAIESIALFAGVILSVSAPINRRLVALIASTVIIYLLNIMRNSFVLVAYGWNWFGKDSFYMAHNVIAKFGSTIALLAVAYLVFLLLPELLSVIDDLFREIKHPGGGTA
ncbi:MAG: archaeosortase A [Methanotrichaceae archaeon]|nr:archaeosortase A [Methanotrichaceae archaeon]